MPPKAKMADCSSEAEHVQDKLGHLVGQKIITLPNTNVVFIGCTVSLMESHWPKVTQLKHAKNNDYGGLKQANT